MAPEEELDVWVDKALDYAETLSEMSTELRALAARFSSSRRNQQEEVKGDD